MENFSMVPRMLACLAFLGLVIMVQTNNATDVALQMCEERPNKLNASYAVFLVAVVIVTVSGNGLVVIVITMSRALRNQTTNLFLRSLAVTDILIGGISLPIKIKQSLQNQYFCMPEAVCWFFFFADTTLSIASVTHLLIVSCDRFIAVRHTFSYDTIMSQRRVYIIIACTWLYSFIWSGLNVIDWSDPSKYGVEWRQSPVPTCSTGNKIYFTTLYVSLFLFPIAVMVLMYGYVFRQALRHIRAITICEVQDNATQRVNRRRRREMKALRAIIIVFVAFCICWIPTVGVALSGFWDLHFWQGLYIRDKRAFDAIFVVCVQVLPPLNSAVNPFIYVLFNDQFRLAFRALLHRFWGKEGTFTNVDRRMTFFSENPILKKQCIANHDPNGDSTEDHSENPLNMTQKNADTVASETRRGSFAGSQNSSTAKHSKDDKDIELRLGSSDGMQTTNL